MSGDSTISEESVRKATGKGWNEWIAILDRWGAARRDHKTIAAYLFEDRGVDGWWAQMVAAQYVRQRRTRKGKAAKRKAAPKRAVRRKVVAKQAVRRKVVAKKAVRRKTAGKRAARPQTTRKPKARRGSARSGLRTAGKPRRRA